MKFAHALVALLSGGCLPTLSRDLPLEAGEIGAAAVVEKGEPKAALLFTKDTTIPLSFGEDTQVFLWKLRPSDFVRSDGSEVTNEELAGVRIRFQDDPPDPTRGSCGRCLAPWSTSPQPIFAGDSCAVPQFGELMVLRLKDREIEIVGGEALDDHGLELADSIRRALLIDWPGDCDCPDVMFEQKPTPRYSFMPPHPESIDEWPFDRFAIHPDGTVAGFRDQRIGVIDPSGVRTLHPRPAVFPDDMGPILSAVAITYLGNPAFVVAATSTDPIDERPYYFLVEVAPTLAVRALSLAEEGFRPSRLRYVDESHFRMLGGSQEQIFRISLASFYECEVDGAKIDCTLGGKLTTSNCSDSEKHRLNDVVFLSRDRLIGGLERGGVVFGVKNDRTWMLDCSEDGTFEHAGATRFFKDSWTGSLHSFPDDLVFLCVGADNEKILMSADFSAATTLDEMRAVAFTQKLAVPGHYAIPCDDFVPGPLPEQVTFVTSQQPASAGGRVAVCSSTSAGCFEVAENAVSGSPVPNRLEQPVPGWTLSSFFTDAVDPDAVQLFRRRDGGPTERVYGRPELDRSYVSPLVVDENQIAVWFTSNSIVRFEWTPEKGVMTSTIVIPDYTWHPIDAALDSSNNTFVVLSFKDYPEDGLFGSTILRVWADPPRFEVIADLAPLETTECGANQVTVFTRIAETSPGKLLAVNPCGWLAQIRGSEVILTQIKDWDDPETPIEETRLPGTWLRSIDVSHGIAWIGGFFGTMVRVHGNRAERFSLERTWKDGEYVDLWEPKESTHVDALKAFCPDRVLFASSHQQYITRSFAPIFGEERYPIETGPFAFHTVDGRARRSEFNRNVQAILGPENNYVLLTTGAWSLQYQVPPVRTLITAHSAVADGKGVLWLGGSDRRLVLGVPPP